MGASSDTTAAADIVLRPRRLRQWGYLALCLGFAAIGFAAVADHQPIGWYVGGVFACGATVCLISLLPSASFLLLAADGLTICSLFRRHVFSWQDIEGFGPTQVQGRPMVGFNIRPGRSIQGCLARLSHVLSGYDAALPDTYGFTADELAALLNRRLMTAALVQRERKR